MKLNTFINLILSVKLILNNLLLLIDNANKKINNVNKKIKFVSFIFDAIFNEFDEFFLKSKTITTIFNVNLINSFKKISNLNTKFNTL